MSWKMGEVSLFVQSWFHFKHLENHLVLIVGIGGLGIIGIWFQNDTASEYTMSRPQKKKRSVSLGRNLPKKKRLEVNFDENDAAIGDHVARFKSYVGVQSRTMISIIYSDRHNVPQIEKDRLWLNIKEYWQIEDDTRKKAVLKICNTTWKGFKKRLVNKFLKTDNDPLTQYTWMNEKDWEQFKALKSTPEFQEKSEIGRQNAKLNKNPARIGPHGYACMRPEWQKKIESGKVSSVITQIQNDRTREYLMARTERGAFGVVTLPTELQPLAAKIIEKDRQLSQGEWVPEPGEDPLIVVLGPEHPGRTRAVGHTIGLRNIIQRIDEKRRKSHKKQDLEEIVERKVNEGMRDIEKRVMQRLMSKYEGTTTGSPGLRKSSCGSAPAFDYLDEIEVHGYIMV